MLAALAFVSGTAFLAPQRGGRTSPVRLAATADAVQVPALIAERQELCNFRAGQGRTISPVRLCLDQGEGVLPQCPSMTETVGEDLQLANRQEAVTSTKSGLLLPTSSETGVSGRGDVGHSSPFGARLLLAVKGVKPAAHFMSPIRAYL